MNLEITFRHMDSSEPLKKYIQEKMSGFSKFLHEPIDVHVVLEVQKKIHQLAEVTIRSKNYRFHCVEESENMYAAVDLVVDKIQRQLVKHKEKVKEHKDH